MLDRRTENLSIEGTQLLPFEMGYLPEVFQEKAVTELNETPENKVQGLLELKEMVEMEKSFREIEMDDGFLVQFLRCEKYNVEDAFTRLKNVIHLKKDTMCIFTGARYEIIVKSLTDSITTFLPYRSTDGSAILYVNINNWIPDEFPILEVKRMAIILLFQAVLDPMNQVNGFHVIIDNKSSPLRHLKYCSFQNLYLMYHGSQNCLPGRFHSYHVVNLSFTGRFSLHLMRYIFPEELKRKIYIHSSPEELLDYFPAEVVPIEYGGQLGSYDVTGWLKKVMEHEELEKMGGKFLRS